MIPDESLVRRRWREMGGQCECRQAGHGHHGHCGRKLNFVKRGQKGPGAWDVCGMIRSSGSDYSSVADTPLIYCLECYEQTLQL